MTWGWYLAGAAVTLALADILVKLAAGRLPDSLGMLLYGMVPFSTGLIWFLAERHRHPADPISWTVYAAAVGVGISFTLVTFCMYAAFRHGAPISVASPVIRMGGLVLASAVGLLFWKEVVTAKYAMGFVLVCAGLVLMLSRP